VHIFHRGMYIVVFTTVSFPDQNESEFSNSRET
jgi:hypothetical protein